jgi:glycerol uptake facilitator-like aquaporin
MLISEIVGTFLLVSVVYAAVDPQRAGAVIHISALGPLAIGGGGASCGIQFTHSMNATAFNPDTYPVRNCLFTILACTEK